MVLYKLGFIRFWYVLHVVLYALPNLKNDQRDEAHLSCAKLEIFINQRRCRITKYQNIQSDESHIMQDLQLS